MIKKILRKIIFREKATSDSYIKYLRKIGVRIGERTVIFAPNDVKIDTQRPWLLEIGDDVQITSGVTILTHGYEWSVLKKVYGDVIGSADKVKIGNNVFIGMNSTILKGVTIGNNVIIGANSLVNKDIPDNVVVAGNPARVIMTIDEFYNKRINEIVEEAKTNVREYYKCYNIIPPKEKLYEFFWIFENRDEDSIKRTPKFKETMELVGNYNESLNKYIKSVPLYDSYEDFIKDCNL